MQRKALEQQISNLRIKLQKNQKAIDGLNVEKKSLKLFIDQIHNHYKKILEKAES